MTPYSQSLWYAGLRTAGIDYLRGLLRADPAGFLDTAEQILNDAEQDDARRQAAIAGQVRFVVRQQPGSDNRT